MVRRTLLPLAAVLAALVMAAGPAHAATPASVELADRSASSSRSMAAACDQPCWPNCLIQTFPCWEIGQYQYLTANSTEDMRTSCISGRHLLGAAQYDWGHILGVHRGWATGRKLWQNLHLAEGGYGMESCLDPHNGGYYTQTTTLWPDNPAHHPISIRQELHIVVSQTYYWGAYLDPLI